MYEFFHKFLRSMGGIGRLLLYGSGACVVGLFLVGGGARIGLMTAGLAMGISGLVFYVIGRQMSGLAGMTQRMRTVGQPGTATVVGIGDTGVTVNNDPVVAFTLDVKVGDGIPYRVETKQLMSRLAVGSFAPGTKLPVLVDPDDPQQVVIDLSGDMPASTALPPGKTGIEGAKVGSAAELLASGKRGSAVITAMQDMGDISDLGLQAGDIPGADDRVFMIQLEVKLPGRDPYTATIGHRVPENLVGKVGPRTAVEVAVGRGDDQEVAIDWASVGK